MNHLVTAILMTYAVADVAALPAPTPQVIEHIRNMGSPNWAVRNAATEKLVSLGPRAIRGLEQAIRTEPDPEIHFRARKICESYFSVGPTSRLDVPSAWSLPDEFVLADGTVLRWGKMDRRLLIRQHVRYQTAVEYSANRTGEYAATYDLCQRLLRGGVPRTDVIRLLDDMEWFGRTYDYSENSWDDDNDQRVLLNP